MSVVLRLALVLCVLVSLPAYAQKKISATLLDSINQEPIAGATIQCTDSSCNCSCITNNSGKFEMSCKDCRFIQVTHGSYKAQRISIQQFANSSTMIWLQPYTGTLNEIIVTANRGERIKRSEAPIAIGVVSAASIQETKAQSADQLLNKISGVNMVNLGNEQHQMSIRQPMTTKSLFLYLEDGIPVRTTGLFNHNALLEMNLAATKKIEVIKGPSSSLYGSEAIGGVVNFISLSPTIQPMLKWSAQGNSIGYKRTDLQTSFKTGKWGFALSGYYADKRNSFMDYTDFHKASLTARADYQFSDRTLVSNSYTYTDYYSDMRSGVDSTAFATKQFFNPQTFTFRKVQAHRFRTTLSHQWNENANSSLSLVVRKNAIGQNPSYRIKDDYKRVNGVWKGNKSLAHGEINESSFKSLAIISQHKQKFDWKNATLLGGLSADLSPSAYTASYIKIHKDTISGKYDNYEASDSSLTNYTTRINNFAGFIQAAFEPAKGLRLVGSIRYDVFQYKFNNQLAPSSFSGAADTSTVFRRLSPKIGLTYNPTNKIGFFANYSEGFVPPQVTELFTGVKVPFLQPSVFRNYEIGGWMNLFKNNLSGDFSIYQLDGSNEIVNMRLDDGSFANQNSGRTSHKGIEIGINANPIKSIRIRTSASYSKHMFEEFVEKGISYSGKEMNNAPRWLFNGEIWYRPNFLNGFRIGTEVQFVGKYYADPQNTASYPGYTVLHIRTAYTYKAIEIWMNVLNAGDRYYSTITSKSSFGYSYTLADPRSYNMGISLDLSTLLKKQP
ncbi:TonB-dependent receptor [Flavihumibacter sp. UBA7668]|uniref:TonB-dependent receptor n=1 Tax=Flavihumibacter sp. UBA7668 TaxID=1946542 RepID=UPI0025C48257|nr:TonB-dependent receptor [Flavihumibacter sp. UBA7668]